MRFMTAYSFTDSFDTCGGSGDAAVAATLATIFGQVADETIHGCVLGGVDQRAAFPSKFDETGMPELVQVEG
jgi:hypothetical protein